VTQLTNPLPTIWGLLVPCQPADMYTRDRPEIACVALGLLIIWLGFVPQQPRFSQLIRWEEGKPRLDQSAKDEELKGMVQDFWRRLSPGLTHLAPRERAQVRL
jgi:hypothetical protein